MMPFDCISRATASAYYTLFDTQPTAAIYFRVVLIYFNTYFIFYISIYSFEFHYDLLRFAFIDY
jgi:hypothetical protein